MWNPLILHTFSSMVRFQFDRNRLIHQSQFLTHSKLEMTDDKWVHMESHSHWCRLMSFCTCREPRVVVLSRWTQTVEIQKKHKFVSRFVFLVLTMAVCWNCSLRYLQSINLSIHRPNSQSDVHSQRLPALQCTQRDYSAASYSPPFLVYSWSRALGRSKWEALNRWLRRRNRRSSSQSSGVKAIRLLWMTTKRIPPIWVRPLICSLCPWPSIWLSLCLCHFGNGFDAHSESVRVCTFAANLEQHSITIQAGSLRRRLIPKTVRNTSSREWSSAMRVESTWSFKISLRSLGRSRHHRKWKITRLWPSSSTYIRIRRRRRRGWWWRREWWTYWKWSTTLLKDGYWVRTATGSSIKSSTLSSWKWSTR